MKRALAVYGIWLAGVLSAAAIAFLYYRRVLALGVDELELELGRRNGHPPDGPAVVPDPATTAGPALTTED